MPRDGGVDSFFLHPILLRVDTARRCFGSRLERCPSPVRFLHIGQNFTRSVRTVHRETKSFGRILRNNEPRGPDDRTSLFFVPVPVQKKKAQSTQELRANAATVGPLSFPWRRIARIKNYFRRNNLCVESESRADLRAIIKRFGTRNAYEMNGKDSLSRSVIRKNHTRPVRGCEVKWRKIYCPFGTSLRHELEVYAHFAGSYYMCENTSSIAHYDKIPISCPVR